MVSAVICMSLRRVWHLCNLPCVFALFRLILLQDMLSSLHEFAFGGQNMKLTVNMLLYTCILYRDAGPAVIRAVFTSTVGRSLSRISYLLLVILAPHDSNVAVYAQVCWLFCVLYMPLFGLVQARPWFRSSIRISSVAGISKMLRTSVVATCVCVCVDVGRTPV